MRFLVGVFVGLLWAGGALAQDAETVSLIPDRFYITLPAGWTVDYDDELLDNFVSGDDLEITISPGLVQRFMLPQDVLLEDFLLAVMAELYNTNITDDALREFAFGGKPGMVYLLDEAQLLAAVTLPDDTLAFVDVVQANGEPLTGADFDRVQQVIGSMGVRGIGTTRLAGPSEPCYISAPTGERVRLRVGPGFNRAALTYLPGGEYEVQGQFEDDADNVWFKLDKNAVAPERDAREIWVQRVDIDERGDCDAVVDALAAPMIPIPVIEDGVVTVRTNGIPPGEGDIVPSGGGYTLSYGTFGSSTCGREGQRAFSIVEEQGHLEPMSGPLVIYEEGASFTFEGIVFAREASGAYLGQVQFGDGTVEYFRLFPETPFFLEGQRTQNVSTGGERCSVSVPITLAGG